MLVIEVDVLEVFLVESYLLTNNELLEVNQTMLDLVALLSHIFTLLFKVLNFPGHVGIVLDYFEKELLLDIMIINEILHDMVRDSIL